MKRSAAKYLAIFCILLIGQGIHSQQTELRGSGDNEATTGTYKADVLGSQTTNAGNSDATTAATSERPSDIVETTSGSGSGDDDLPTNPNSQQDKSNGVTETTEAPEALQETQTPAVDEAVTEQAIDENLVPATTTVSTEVGKTDAPTTTKGEAATEPSTIACTAIGNISSTTDCHAYSTCALTLAGDLESTDQLCPPKMAFNIELSRCTRDISDCNDDGIVCTIAGTFADSHSNASYYWCVPRQPVGSFRKYHIDCEAGKVYVPQLGKCFIDINNLQNLPLYYGKDEDDEDIVKAELKQFKAADKLKLKEQKQRDKLEKKLQKELAKKAAKDAKEQAKLNTNSEEDD